MPVPQDSQAVTGKMPDEEAFLQEKMLDPAVVEQMKNMAPEEQAAFMRRMFQDYAGQTQANNQAMSQADALRSGGAPQGVQAGNQYVAASPLSHIARGMNQYSGNRDYKQAEQAQKALSQDRTAGTQQAAAMQAGLQAPAVPPRQQPMKPDMFQRAGNSMSEYLRNMGG